MVTANVRVQDINNSHVVKNVDHPGYVSTTEYWYWVQNLPWMTLTTL